MENEKWIEFLIKKNPQTNSNNEEINWVFTGGVAVYLLLNYEIENYKKKIKKKIKRECKDIDIYSFKKNNFVDNVKKISILEIDKEINFTKNIKINNEKKYIDSTYKYHFEYFLPSKKEIVKVNMNGIEIYCLSPEYLLTFKSFGLMRFREKDYVDSINLIDTIQLNKKTIIKNINKTAYKNLIKEKEKENILKEIKSKQIFKNIETRVKNSLKVKNKNINFENINYSLISSIIEYYDKIKPIENIKLPKIIQTLKIDKEIGKFIFLIGNFFKLTKENITNLILLSAKKTLEINKEIFNFEDFYIIYLISCKYLSNNNKLEEKTLLKIFETEHIYSAIINQTLENNILEFWENLKDYDKQILSIFIEENSLTNEIKNIKNKKKK